VVLVIALAKTRREKTKQHDWILS